MKLFKKSAILFFIFYSVIISLAISGEIQGNYKPLEYKSIAELRLSNPSTNDQIASLAGYYASTENRNWRFQWDSASTETDNGGTIIKGIPATGRWIRIFDGDVEYDIRMFGCVGDDSTDNIILLEIADTTATADGVTLVISDNPDDIFRISTMLTLNAKHVRGRGHIKSTVTTNGTAAVLIATEGALIEDFKVSGNSKRRGISVGGNVTHVDNVTLRNLTVVDCGVAGIRLALSNHSIIENCRISGVVSDGSSTGGEGIYVGDSEYVIITNNFINDFNRIGIVVKGLTVESVQPIVSENVIWNAHDSDSYAVEHNAGIWLEGCNGGKIINNTIYDIAGNANQSNRPPFGIVVAVGLAENDSVFIVNGNDIDMYYDVPLGTDPCYGFSISCSGENVYITDNSVKNCVDHVVRIAGSMNNVTIENLHVDGFKNVDIDSQVIRIGSDEGQGNLKVLKIRNLTQSNFTISDIVGVDYFQHLQILTNDSTDPDLPEITIESCDDFGFVNVLGIPVYSKLTVLNSKMLYGDTGTYRSVINNGVVRLINTSFERWPGRAVTGEGPFYLLDDIDLEAIGCKFSNVRWDMSNGVQQTFDVDMNFADTKFDIDASITIDPDGSIQKFKFDNCIVDEYRTSGFFTNGLVLALGEVRVRSCTFTRTTDVAPFNRVNNDPAVSIFQNNDFNSTALHDYVATDADTNNTSL